jgi:hypothetical protein
MAPSVGPVTATHMEDVRAERTASPKLASTASKAAERVVERTEPIDSVELNPDLLGDLQQLRAAGPGVPLFTVVELPATVATGKTSSPEARASGRDSLVDAFG